MATYIVEKTKNEGNFILSATAPDTIVAAVAAANSYQKSKQAQYNEEHLASILNEEAGKIKEMQGAYERGNDDMASSMQDNIFSDLAYKNNNGTYFRE